MQRPMNIYFVSAGENVDSAALANADLAIKWDPKTAEKRTKTQVTTGKVFKDRDGTVGRVVQIVKNL